jgi:hypothetical protein
MTASFIIHYLVHAGCGKQHQQNQDRTIHSRLTWLACVTLPLRNGGGILFLRFSKAHRAELAGGAEATAVREAKRRSIPA